MMRIMKSAGVLAAAVLLGLSVNGATAASSTPDLNTEVRHQLVMLPFYSIFDNLEYEITNEGEVVLSGEVMRPVLKSDAGNAVRRIPGVTKVTNNIKVLPLSTFDDRIRLAEYRSIYGTQGFEKYAIQAVPPIHIIVENGKVTLEGVVGSKADKDLAGIKANSVPFVFGVTNDLQIGH